MIKTRFLRSVGIHIGTTVGVGVFGLPYVLYQAGIIPSLVQLVIVAIGMALLLLMFGEMVKRTKGQHRFVEYISRYLGKPSRPFVALVYFSSIYGAFLAFIILGGDFLHQFLSVFTNGFSVNPSVPPLIVFAVVSLLIYLGSGGIGKLALVTVPIILGLYAFLMILSAPHIDLSAIQLTHSGTSMLLPYGVYLFAFFGISAIPEMHDVLRSQSKLPKSILVGVSVIALLYTAFSFIVASASGAATSPDAFSGLSSVLSSSVLTIGSLLGLISVISIFAILGVETMRTFEIDMKLKKNVAWILTISLPLALFLLGFKSFIGVIDFVGSFIFGVLAILIVLAYERFKRSRVCSIKHCWMIPTWVSSILILLFVFGISLTFVYT